MVTRSVPDMLADLDQFVQEARDNKVKIYYSTIVYTEFRPRYFKGARHGEISSFFADFGRAFNPIEPNPNILMWAGRLRDADSINPSDPKIADEFKRRIGIGDSIHLATAIYAKDVYGHRDLIVHSFDLGKGKTAEGKCVPIVGFEKWFPTDKRTSEVKAVCNLTRVEPRHPNPDLATKGGGRS